MSNYKTFDQERPQDGQIVVILENGREYECQYDARRDYVWGAGLEWIMVIADYQTMQWRLATTADEGNE